MPARQRGRRLGIRGEQVVDVERPRADAIDLSFPETPRPVGVDLDPVVVGIAQVQRLAHEVIRSAGQLDAIADRMLHPAGQVAALGHEQREVEEAGVAVGRPHARLLDEAQELTAGGAQTRLTLAEPEQVEPDRLGVVGERSRQVRHGEVNGSDGRLRGDRHRLGDHAVHLEDLGVFAIHVDPVGTCDVPHVLRVRVAAVLL